MVKVAKQKTKFKRHHKVEEDVGEDQSQGDVLGLEDERPTDSPEAFAKSEPEVSMIGILSDAIEPELPAEVPTPKRIVVIFEALDGAKGMTKHTELKWARKEAHSRVGAHPTIGSHYAVSDDGVVKVMVEGATLGDLFPEEEVDLEGEEEKASNSVVADKFKKNYVENARAQGLKGKAPRRSNWDWLAQEIARECLNEKHKIDINAFLAILTANGIDHTKWPNRNKGWEGRLRMTGRVALQRIVADTGVLKFPVGSDSIPPAAFVEKYKTKA